MPGPFGPAWTLALYVALVVSAAVPASRVDTRQVTEPPATVAYVDGEPCGQWWHLAQDVGWPRDQLPTMARVMRCESQCQPQAYNRSGASGLMQVMPFHAHGRDLFEPETNLVVALEVWHSQGWHAWSCY